MCGKFTALASWSEVVAFSQPLTSDASDATIDQSLTFRVMSALPVIIWDRDKAKRRVVQMGWGFPDPNDWRRPKPVHARAESIDTTRAFAEAFRDGQRGIVLVKTFNEAPDVTGPTIQHTITPGDEPAIGIAFVWRRFQITDMPGPLVACCMVTVPANKLIASLPTDRMPAVLSPEDWAKWLGEVPASPEAVKSCLKTVEGVRWTMAKEERVKKAKRGKPTVSDPTGLF
jgi:putative SOS response-associated peptidase YedK